MPLTFLGGKRAARVERATRLRDLFFPDGYTERVVRCHACGRRGTVRDAGRWHTVAEHTCPGPWIRAGFTEITR
jgi:hypothetical protein